MRNSYLLVVPFDRPGGAERVMKLTALYLAKGNDVSVLILKYKKYGFWEECEQTCNVYYLAAERERNSFLQFFNWFSKKSIVYDFIFTSHIHTNSLVAIARKLNFIKSTFHVARESTFVFDRFKGIRLLIFYLWYNLGYRFIDRHIFQTIEMRNRYLTSYPQYFRKECKVVPNPLDIPRLNDQAEESVIMPPISIVMIGTLTKNKGQELVIELLPFLHKEVHLILLGEGEDYEKLKLKAEEKGLKDRVVFEGMVSNVAKYCRAAKVCVHASWKEGFPNSLLEMMTVNSRIASTISTKSIESIPGILKSNPGDMEALLINIKTLLYLNSDDDYKSRNNIDNYLKKHSVESFVNELFN